MFDFGLLPPEINSGRIYTGPGSGPLLAAAAAWSGLSADLQSAAAGHRAVITGLTSSPWLGPASEALVAAVTPFIAWLDLSADESALAASQSYAAAAAYEAAFTASVPPPVIAANRALLALLVATNFFGQNTPAIAATEALYLEFWAQDAAAMYTYAGSSAAATELAELPAPAEVVDPTGLVDQAIAVVKSEGQLIQTQLDNLGSQLSPRVADVLKTLSAPLNGNGTTIDQWLIANTPLDDIVPLYSKYVTPYVSSITAVFQSGQALGQASSGSIAITNFLGPAAKAAEGAAKAAGAAAANIGTKVSSVTASLGRSVPLSGLSVPASWTTATGASGATAAGNAVPAALETTPVGAAVGSGPMAPPFGQFFNAGNGRKTPTYGHRLTFMTRPPAAG